MAFPAIDPFLFYKRGIDGLEEIQVTQVEDTCGVRSEKFSMLEIAKFKAFNSTPRILTFPLKFNGLWIDKTRSNGYSTDQFDYFTSIKEINPSQLGKCVSK